MQRQLQIEIDADIARAIAEAQRENVEADRTRDDELAKIAAIDAEDTRAKTEDRAMFEAVVNKSQQLMVRGLVLEHVSAEEDDCFYRSVIISMKSQYLCIINGLNRQAIAHELMDTASANRNEYLKIHSDLAKSPATYNYGKTLEGFARFHAQGHGESNELVVAAASNLIAGLTIEGRTGLRIIVVEFQTASPAAGVFDNSQLGVNGVVIAAKNARVGLSAPHYYACVHTQPARVHRDHVSTPTELPNDLRHALSDFHYTMDGERHDDGPRCGISGCGCGPSLCEAMYV